MTRVYFNQSNATRKRKLPKNPISLVLRHFPSQKFCKVGIFRLTATTTITQPTPVSNERRCKHGVHVSTNRLSSSS